INPGTGKPCDQTFSRPYDLTRHEDTVHNSDKNKRYCTYCIPEKKLAGRTHLTRHHRVCHPDIE
ncbi:hypothetical protein B0T14DRAFT_413057, partial [Immersiella caudata]